MLSLVKLLIATVEGTFVPVIFSVTLPFTARSVVYVRSHGGSLGNFASALASPNLFALLGFRRFFYRPREYVGMRNGSIRRRAVGTYAPV